ncbi:hypothetical protein ECANGB1_1852 [Enterospora canceri]|uniref:Dihydrofolate reductase n=1 Tax=Enterospora canceri TaxID=1081671 RepID=A0A1Y1S5F8_9MICR|nr:hypothetical protein ECANGB1_1852 [Enterospora canceri]
MNHIMELDKNVVIILGRKTLEVAKYTKYDKIVLSRNTHDKSDKTTYVKSFDEALKAAGNRTVIVAGGQEIYSEALKRDYKLFITVIEEDEMVGDRIFPVEDEALLNKVNVTDEFVVECNAKKEKYSMKDGFVVENGHKFRFYTVEK